MNCKINSLAASAGAAVSADVFWDTGVGGRMGTAGGRPMGDMGRVILPGRGTAAPELLGGCVAGCIKFVSFQVLIGRRW